MRQLPFIAIVLGIAGLLPFIGCSLGALTQGDWAMRSLLGLAAYSAVILSFLGGVHWGIGLEPGSPQTVRVQRARFVGGIVPSRHRWAGLLVVFIGLPIVGLGILVAGYIATTIAEARAARLGLIPRSYMALRWVLSVGVILCLVSVMIVTAFGGHVIL